MFLRAVKSIQPLFTQHWTNTIESTAIMYPDEDLKTKIPDDFKIAQIFRNQINVRDAKAVFSTAIFQGQEAPSQDKTGCFRGATSAATSGSEQLRGSPHQNVW
jgi:hypothetical protein